VNNLTEGVAAEASGEIQSMTMLASTTGIEFAGYVAAVGEHEIGGRPAPALRPAQNLLRKLSPLPQAEVPVPFASQGLDVATRHQKVFAILPRLEPPGPSPSPDRFGRAMDQRRCGQDRQFVRRGLIQIRYPTASGVAL
jgi:hypothetical protein